MQERVTRLHLASLLALALVGSVARAGSTIFWESSPVLPNQTVLVQGDGFSADMPVSVGRLEDSDPGEPGGTHRGEIKWEKVRTHQVENYSFKFTIPGNFQPGVYAYRVGSRKAIDEARLLNVPEVWWFQGDQDRTASAGGYLRVFGVSLDINNGSQVVLVKDGKTTKLTKTSHSQWAIAAAIPDSMPPGEYEVFVHNGSGGEGCWMSGGKVEIAAPAEWPDNVFNVVEYGANASVLEAMCYDPNLVPAKENSTAAIKKALNAAKDNGGGIVYFPAGQYLVTEMLEVPKYTVIKGDGANDTAIEWPMNLDDTPDALILGTSNFKVQDISISAQNHFAGIKANDGHAKDSGHVHVERVDIQLNRFLSLTSPRHLGNYKELNRTQWEHYSRIGAVHIGGEDIRIVDCRILSSKESIVVDQASGVISGNVSRYPTTVSSYQGWQIFIRGGGPLIFENNDITGGGIGVTTHNTIYYNKGKQAGQRKNLQIRNCYIANNTVKDCYRGDAEGLTYDQHGPFVIYGDTIKSGAGLEVELKKNISDSWVNCQISVLDGKGRGQRRFIARTTGDVITVDREWDVPLDETSYVVIYKGYYRHLIIDNAFSNVGCAQLWGAGNDFVCAGNTLDRAGSMHSTSFSYHGGITPAIRCQFLGNRVIAGLGPGASYRHLRATMIGANTYPPPDGYVGPMSIAQIMRGNVIENHGWLFIRGRVSDGIIEGNTIKNSDCGVLVDQQGGRWTPQAGGQKDYIELLKDAPPMPEGIVMRENRFDNVKIPYKGDRLENNYLQDIDIYRKALSVTDFKVSCETMFAKDTLVTASTRAKDAEIFYTINGDRPGRNSTRYTGPVKIDKSVTFKAIAMNGPYHSDIITRELRKIDGMVYLSTLPETEAEAHMGLKKDSNYAGTGPVAFGGRSYKRSLMACPANPQGRGYVSYNLGGPLAGVTRFRAEVGVDDAVGGNGTVVFVVELKRGGKWSEEFKSQVLRGGKGSVPVDVDITGADALRLVTTDAGDGINADHAVWAGARVCQQQEED